MTPVEFLDKRTPSEGVVDTHQEGLVLLVAGAGE
jgi:hypothetical protein